MRISEAILFGLLATAAVFTVETKAGAQSPVTLEGMRAYNNGDFATALRLLRQGAEAGDPEAQVNLGYLYARGQGVSIDQREALRLYQLSADQGNSEGMNALGYKYLFGSAVTADTTVAVHWFCLAIAQGNPRAMNNLAEMLNSGRYVMRDEDEARSLWEQSANLGHANSMVNLALSYLRGTKPDPAKGEDWLIRAAKSGQGVAQRMLLDKGYRGTFPPSVEEATKMIPAPKEKSGHSKLCGASGP